MKITNSSALTLTGLAILAAMAWKGVDVSGSIVALVASYVGSRQIGKASHVWAASKDSTADTASIIREIEK